MRIDGPLWTSEALRSWSLRKTVGERGPSLAEFARNLSERGPSLAEYAQNLSEGLAQPHKTKGRPNGTECRSTLKDKR